MRKNQRMQRKTLLAGLAATAAVAGISPLAARAQSKPLAYRIAAEVVADRICIPQTIFNPGDVIVWRADITDPSGAKIDKVKAAALGLSAVVSLRDGTKIPLAMSVHPPFPNAPATESYWSASWKVQPTHPTGTLPWTLAVTDTAGNQVSFAPIGQGIGLGVLTIAEKGAAPAGGPPPSKS